MFSGKELHNLLNSLRLISPIPSPAKPKLLFTALLTPSIKDNGIGIKKEHHQRIFKIFNALGTHEKSTGVGLSIVKKVIDLYEGEIWLDSEVGKGTVFFFSLKKQS